MAEGFINQTEGSGKKARTWQSTIGANTVEEQYVLEGEAKQISWTTQVLGVSIATSTDHILQIMAGASNKVRIKRIKIQQVALSAAGGLARFQIVRLTTAGTGGSSLTVNPYEVGDTVSVTARSLTTSKGTEGAVLGVLTIGCTSVAPATLVNREEEDWGDYGVKPLIIPAGTSNGIALVVQAGIATTPTVDVWIEGIETSY